jgi:N-acyl-D-aspartate/D-glutamate deacylase
VVLDRLGRLGTGGGGIATARLSAAKLGLRDRGLLRPGQYADLAIFDPERVLDRATYTEPFQYSEGIEYVIVNGRVVLDKGKHTGARPGRALRHES